MNQTGATGMETSIGKTEEEIEPNELSGSYFMPINSRVPDAHRVILSTGRANLVIGEVAKKSAASTRESNWLDPADRPIAGSSSKGP
jgi:hypothetical protein